MTWDVVRKMEMGESGFCHIPQCSLWTSITILFTHIQPQEGIPRQKYRHNNNSWTGRTKMSQPMCDKR